VRRLSVIEPDESCSSATGCCDSPYQYYSGEGGHRHRVRSGESRRASHHSQIPHARQRTQSGLAGQTSACEPTHHRHRETSRHSDSSPESESPRRRLPSNARSPLARVGGGDEVLAAPVRDRVRGLRDEQDGHQHRSPGGERHPESYDVSPRTRVLSRPSLRDVDLPNMEVLRLDDGTSPEVDRGRPRATKHHPSGSGERRSHRLAVSTDLPSHAQLRQMSSRYPQFQAPPDPYQQPQQQPQQHHSPALEPMQAAYDQRNTQDLRGAGPARDSHDGPPGEVWPLPERRVSPTRQHRSLYPGHDPSTLWSHSRLRLAEPKTPGRD